MRIADRGAPDDRRKRGCIASRYTLQDPAEAALPENEPVPRPPDTPSHPGAFVREHVIPSGMSVTDAAKKLDVGRPALSNMLNGKSSLSPKMAVRLEKAFGFDRRQLLDLQAAFNLHAHREEEKLIAVRPHVPDFLTVKARQIHDWPDSKSEARRLLPVLLRKLIHSTGADLRHVDFPGYDNAEQKGWDGRVEAGAATPWIPEGKSGWEFGVGKDPDRKAEHDYAARLRSIPADEREGCAFVFVTPRNWSHKADWVKGKQAAGDWKAVRAFDASDLEQWLEVSISARIWLAEKLGWTVGGFKTLNECRRRWAEASEPALTPAIFAPSLAAYRDPFRDWLKKPPGRPFTVAADSRDEALAFLASLFEEDGIDTRWRDLAAVFDSAEALRKLAESSAPFLPVVHTDEVERELAAIHPRRHCIAVRPRNSVDPKPDIALELLNHGAFRDALVDMGIDESDVYRWARESGRSPTILRRRLSDIPAIRKPEWAADHGIARALIPMVLVGAWRDDFSADREVVSFWGNGGYDRIKEDVARFVQFYDSPLWSVGWYRGVASKIDALFAIAGYITGQDLDDFFFLAEHVLSETDPALDLPEHKRWGAAPYDKVRDHSPALREGICETLVLLAVHGNDLFRHRLGIDVAARISGTIRDLLTPLTIEKLLSHDNDLPRYAEAAPEEFLNLIEADLRQPEPTVLGLLKPAGNDIFDRCPRTGLLWAMECLAWKHLGRVSEILARLSKTAIDDNWANKPIASLEGIYRSWLPQTAASFEERMRSLESLVARFPDVGWRICVGQFDTDSQVALPAYRPRWRSDASGAGRAPIPAIEIREYMRRMLDLMLAWRTHDQNTLGDLVNRLRWLPDDKDRTRVWDLIDTWAMSEVDDGARDQLRNRIRSFAFSRHNRKFLDSVTKARAGTAYAKLEPANLVIRHVWIFASPWIHFSDVENEELDLNEHTEKIRRLRDEAMQEIWKHLGFGGVTALLAARGLPDIAGISLTSTIQDRGDRVVFLLKCLSITDKREGQMDSCLRGFLRSLGDDAHDAIVETADRAADADRIARLLRCAPFTRDTWRLLDRFDAEMRVRYWSEVIPGRNWHSDAEMNELIDCLLVAKRPRAAFNAVEPDWSRVETLRLERLLRDSATVDAEPAASYHLNPYSISEALSALGRRAGVTLDDMALLEFMYFDALHGDEHGIPNIERCIAASPTFFVQVLAMVFKRDDGGEDPPEWKIEDPDRGGKLAHNAYRLLRRISRVPGAGEDGKIDTGKLLAWVIEAQRLCAERGRAEIGDRYIGQLLSNAPAEEDGTWPCLPVCEAMQRIESPKIGEGFNLGVQNSRGAYVKAMNEGGEQERALAEKYRNWATRRAFDYPHVASVLESIAASYDRQATWEDDETSARNRLWN